MSAVGYSTAPLVKKLGIKPGARICFLQAPPAYNRTLGGLPGGITQLTSLGSELNFIQYFAKGKKDLKAKFPKLKKAIVPDGAVWISWPKKASKVETDLTENVIREIGLANGMVDVKVCSVDETWSALKFAYRVKDRK